MSDIKSQVTKYSSKGADVGTPSRTKQIIAEHGFTFKKSLGQNFLIDGNILNRIVAAAELDEQTGALEIGPGIGALTEKLTDAAGAVAAIEIDRRLIPILQKLEAEKPNLTVIQGDVLELELSEVLSQHLGEMKQVSVVANLPYYVTTPIIMKLLELRLPLKHIVIMIQKEVAQRIAAKPGGKDYGSLSVAVQYYCEPQIMFTVPQTVFIPQPNVDSAVIRLTVRQQPAVAVKDEAFFFRVVQACFAQRRKTLNNNLTALVGKQHRELLLEVLERIKIDPMRRGETLSLQEFADLSDALLALDIVT